MPLPTNAFRVSIFPCFALYLLISLYILILWFLIFQRFLYISLYAYAASHRLIRESSGTISQHKKRFFLLPVFYSLNQVVCNNCSYLQYILCLSENTINCDIEISSTARYLDCHVLIPFVQRLPLPYQYTPVCMLHSRPPPVLVFISTNTLAAFIKNRIAGISGLFIGNRFFVYDRLSGLTGRA